MRRYISFLPILVVAFGVSHAVASDCVDETCDFEQLGEEIRTQVDVLTPGDQTENLWADYSESEVLTAKLDSDDDNVEIIEEVYEIEDADTCEFDYNCPFDTPAECEIWYKKPMHKQAVAPRSPHLNSVKIDGILAAMTFQGGISANDDLAKPLLDRYQTLMRTSKTCCTDGIVYKLRQDGANNEDIYEFLKDDANAFGIGARCTMMSDADIAEEYSYGVTGAMVADVRSSCICKNRKWFDTLLEPFYDLYQMAPGFEYTPFIYTYLDGLQRETSVSVNQDVQNIMHVLESCPD